MNIDCISLSTYLICSLVFVVFALGLMLGSN